MSVRRVAATASTILAACCLASCVRLPTGGPVNEVKDYNGLAQPIEGPYSDPRPPQVGATPSEIVQGFLDAMTATPVQTNAAKPFLTKAAQAAWNPQNGVVVYGNTSPPHGSSPVSVHLNSAHAIGPQGNWLGRIPSSQARVTFPMRRVNGQWRIAHVPDALVVPATWFQQNYQSVLLYFFDPTGQILVPEPIYVPRGKQLPTAVVRSLLIGPRSSLLGVARSFIPQGLSTGLSPVLITDHNVAEVTLRGPVAGQLSDKSTKLMLAQFAWTLRQASVRAFTLTIAGRQVTDSSGNSTFKVGSYAKYDPTYYSQPAFLYALHKGMLVSGQANRPTATPGPFGTSPRGVGSFAVSPDGNRIAATTGSSLVVGPVQETGGVTEVLSGGTGLLRPSWDFDGRLWEIESAPSGGALVVCLPNGHRPHRVHVPGISGKDVKRFLVSRDGSRLVAVVRGASADRVMVSRLRYDASGRPLGATRARGVPWQGTGSARVRDIGWIGPTTLAVLHLATQDVSEVREVAVDGSTSPSEAAVIPIPGRVRGVVTSPVASETSYAVLPRMLFDIAIVDPSPSVAISGLSGITYAG